MSKTKEALMDGLLKQQPPNPETSENYYGNHTPSLRNSRTIESLLSPASFKRLIHSYESVDGCEFDTLRALRS